ncbi:MAG: hypothetical protein IT294_12705 [Deltaproteobacteria bacterium]|nr:hypothetical protein [Deltaproteobacteria bacterium]
MPDADSVGPFVANDALAWVQQRWRWILVVLLVLFLTWRFPGSRPDENGRYVLVKDDVPCQIQPDDEDGRRWCYVVLDTRSGKLEERLRAMETPKRK